MGYINTTRDIQYFIPFIEKALVFEGEIHAVKDALDYIWEGKRQLWVKDDGLMITKIEQWPRRKFLRVWLAAGNLKDIMAMQPLIEEFAIQEGCDSLVCGGRKGWGKVLGTIGWEEDHSRSFVKVL